MSLVSFHDMLLYAKQHHFAVGAFNVLNMETIQAVIAANEKANTPVIIQVYHEHLDYAGADYLSSIGIVAAQKAKIPVCLSLDHGRSYEQALLCIKNGFTGVMIDLASSDYQKNVEITRKVVSVAHAKGVSVEAELGRIFDASSPVEIRNSAMTDPQTAAQFVKDTNIDALAVSIGTAHGFYSSAPRIDFKRLEQILKLVSCPIVVHGGSNIPDKDLIEIVRLGVSKVNIGTDLMAAFEQGMRETMDGDKYVDICHMLESGRAKVEETCAQKIRQLTSFRV